MLTYHLLPYLTLTYHLLPYLTLTYQGWPFGAPQHLRLSYGGIAPEQVLTAVEQLRQGFQALKTLGETREMKG